VSGCYLAGVHSLWIEFQECVAAQLGLHVHGEGGGRRPWWDYAIIAGAIGIFLWLGSQVMVPPLAMSGFWTVMLCLVMLFAVIGCGWWLWKRTRFS